MKKPVYSFLGPFFPIRATYSRIAGIGMSVQKIETPENGRAAASVETN